MKIKAWMAVVDGKPTMSHVAQRNGIPILFSENPDYDGVETIPVTVTIERIVPPEERRCGACQHWAASSRTVGNFALGVCDAPAPAAETGRAFAMASNEGESCPCFSARGAA